MQDLLLFGAGIVVGVMNAVAGGGLLLGFPALLAAGLSPLSANITGNIVVLPGLVSSVFGYRKYLRTVPRRYMVLLIPCFLGAMIGAITLRLTPSARFQQLVPSLILFAVVLFAFQPFLHFRLHRHMHSKSKRPKSLVPISLALLPMTIYGGYFGAGFGFMMLAFLGFTKLQDIHQMNALKNLAGGAISIASIICLFSTHLINWKLGLVMAAGNFTGGYFGSRAAQRVSSHVTRIIVILIGLTTAVYLGLRTY
jgi:uncharacterized membrane protein YfcA